MNKIINYDLIITFTAVIAFYIYPRFELTDPQVYKTFSMLEKMVLYLKILYVGIRLTKTELNKLFLNTFFLNSK